MKRHEFYVIKIGDKYWHNGGLVSDVHQARWFEDSGFARVMIDSTIYDNFEIVKIGVRSEVIGYATKNVKED